MFKALVGGVLSRMVDNMEQELRKHRCCFTGHRPHKIGMDEKTVKELLRKAIKEAIADGFVTFISGMAHGVDLWAAEIVLEERKNNSFIHLICASPYEGFEKKWDDTERELYHSIMEQADLVKFVCEHYFRGCYQVRNEWMVDRSARVIAVFNGEPSGTKNTVVYAQKKGIEVHNVLKN